MNEEQVIKQLKQMKIGLSKKWLLAENISNNEEARMSGQVQGLNMAIEIIKSNKKI